jgi:hypothetical protein
VDFKEDHSTGAEGDPLSGVTVKAGPSHSCTSEIDAGVSHNRGAVFEDMKFAIFVELWIWVPPIAGLLAIVAGLFGLMSAVPKTHDYDVTRTDIYLRSCRGALWGGGLCLVLWVLSMIAAGVIIILK